MDYLNNPDLVIRSFTANDRPLVEEFFANLGEEGSWFFNRNRGNEKGAYSWFEGNPRKIVCFMAELKGKMLGYLFFYENQNLTPWLGIAVREDAKGCHIGTRLMAFGEDYARKHNKGGILLTTDQKNFRGQALYEKSGYKREGIHTSGEFLYIRYFEDPEV